MKRAVFFAAVLLGSGAAAFLLSGAGAGASTGAAVAASAGTVARPLGMPDPASAAAASRSAGTAQAAASSAPRPFAVEDMLELKRLSDPRLSPDGRRVAFVVTIADRQANTRTSHIWIVPLVGGDPAQFLVSDKPEDAPRWSPDGGQLAYVTSREGGSQIWVAGVDAAGRAVSPRRLTSIATEAGGPRWSPDGRSIVFVSDVYPACDAAAAAPGAAATASATAARAAAASAAAAASTMSALAATSAAAAPAASSASGVSGSAPPGSASLDCNARTLQARAENPVKARVLEGLLFRHWVSWKDGRFSHLFIVPVDGSAPPRDLTPGAADVPPFSLGGPDDYAVSPDSRELAYAKKTDTVEATSTNSDLFLLDLTDPKATARRITTNPAADAGPAYSPDGRFLAFRAQQRAGFEADRWQLMLYDRRTGDERSLTAALDRSVDSYTWSPDARALFVTLEDQGSVALYRVHAATGAATRLLDAGANSDLDVTRDGRTLVFTRAGIRAPAELFRASIDGTSVQSITHLNDAYLAPFALRAPEKLWYEGAGGTKIQAWVVKPASFQDGRRYPLLFLVHGGPQNAWDDAWTYRWNAEVFANAGYVVFMPNPRGSTGFGQQFVDEISGDWGGRVYEDLMKGADFAESLPYVERGRTGAAGASFGGYMMDWFLGHTTRFRAIVTHSGVYNLTSMYGVTEELWFPEWDLKGTPWTNPELYAKFSPHTYANNFKTPTLVTHGELDFRVPIGEGLQLFTTLQRLGVPSKMVYFPDEGHWINKPGNSALWYHEFIAWMDRWVKG